MISIETLTLKNVLSKMTKCAGDDKNIPITQLMHIKSTDDCIEFTTTDLVNTLTYSLYPLEGKVFGDLDVSVMVGSFSALISKFTCPMTSFELSESGNEIKVHGNGDYTISLPLDVSGTPIVYPESDIKMPTETDKSFTSELEVIQNIFKACDGSITKINKDLQVEDYPRTNYYVDEDGCITLDGFKITMYKTDLIPFKALIYPSTVKLLPIFSDLNVTVTKTSSHLVFASDNITMYSKEADGVDTYLKELAVGLVEQPIEATVDVAVGGLSSALVRLKLFIEKNDMNMIKLTFGKNGMWATTLKGVGKEQISAEELTDFECNIDADNLLSQLKSYADTDVVTIGYGDENLIQLGCGDIEQIVSLSDE